MALQYESPVAQPDVNASVVSVPRSHPPTRGGPLAVSMIALCILVTLTMMFIIYWRWVQVAEPTTGFIIQGDASWDGMEIVVSSDEHPDIKVALTKDNAFGTPILLQPGRYSVTATHAGERVLEQHFKLQPRKYWQINLTPRDPAQPQTQQAG